MKNKQKKILKFTDKNTAQRNEFKIPLPHTIVRGLVVT